MELSKENSKLVATAMANGCKIIAFDLPAGITCPFRGAIFIENEKYSVLITNDDM